MLSENANECQQQQNKKKYQLISRVPDQDGVSQAWYIVEIHHSGWEPSILH